MTALISLSNVSTLHSQRYLATSLSPGTRCPSSPHDLNPSPSLPNDLVYDLCMHALSLGSNRAGIAHRDAGSEQDGGGVVNSKWAVERAAVEALAVDDTGLALGPRENDELARGQDRVVRLVGFG